ncbi:protein kinase family protein [Striga asiatica]|uniref:Protein kinase family protein n=1 Tax=Striga asiatica TaxID=4170 RepID=A0A5A7QR53_STRAF|nr:protein kinase family protein [Striga asiatica]
MNTSGRTFHISDGSLADQSPATPVVKMERENGVGEERWDRSFHELRIMTQWDLSIFQREAPIPKTRSSTVPTMTSTPFPSPARCHLALPVVLFYMVEFLLVLEYLHARSIIY